MSIDLKLFFVSRYKRENKMKNFGRKYDFRKVTNQKKLPAFQPAPRTKIEIQNIDIKLIEPNPFVVKTEPQLLTFLVGPQYAGFFASLTLISKDSNNVCSTSTQVIVVSESGTFSILIPANTTLFSVDTTINQVGFSGKLCANDCCCCSKKFFVPAVVQEYRATTIQSAPMIPPITETYCTFTAGAWKTIGGAPWNSELCPGGDTYETEFANVFPGGLVLSGHGSSLTFMTPGDVRDFLTYSPSGNPLPSETDFYIQGVYNNYPNDPNYGAYALEGVAVQILSAYLNICYSEYQHAQCSDDFGSIGDFVWICVWADTENYTFSNMTLSVIKDKLEDLLFNPLNTRTQVVSQYRLLANVVNESFDECRPSVALGCLALPE